MRCPRTLFLNISQAWDGFSCRAISRFPHSSIWVAQHFACAARIPVGVKCPFLVALFALPAWSTRAWTPFRFLINFDLWLLILFFFLCERRIHFARLPSSVFRAISVSLNYHSPDKLKGPPLSSGSWLVLITLSLPYHTLRSLAISESYCLRQEVRGRRGMPDHPFPLTPKTASLHSTVDPTLSLPSR